MSTYFLKSFVKIIACFTICFFIQSSSIAQKKYPSLLWEISGNGLKKPSYLYGTMHVSSKVAFHLSDAFFDALKNVDVVGLESNPDEWLRKMNDLGLLNSQKYQIGYGGTTDFYRHVFDIKIPNNDQIKSILASDPDIVNGLLYRFKYNQENFEESTYIDLFIYQTGSKWNKKLISLEDFKTSMIMSRKAEMPDIDQETDYSSSKYQDYYSALSQIDDAYRNGDLDALDSLTKATYLSKNYEKYLINDRNVIMAHNMDSVMHNASLFSGIGAAHLPGKDGVIELLRQKGYTVKPVMSSVTKKSKKTKDEVDNTTKILSFKTQYASDSLYTYKLPGTAVRLLNANNVTYDLYPDMTNGAYYTITRLTTNAPLYNYTPEKIMQKLDSLFYENIPGKIIDKKTIKSNTGLSGYDIVNQTKRGDFQRYTIFVNDREIIVFKMAGKSKYVKEESGKAFFESIKFQPKDTKTILYSPPTKGFSVKLPSDYSYEKLTELGYSGRAENVCAFDKKTNTSYGITHAFYHDFNYLEEDTFELNLLRHHFLKSVNYTVSPTTNFKYDQKVPSVEFTALNEQLKTKIAGKIYIKGPHYYLVYAIGNNSTTLADEFFNSFKLTDFTYANELKIIPDTELHFTVKDEVTTETEENDIEKTMNEEYLKQDALKNKQKFKTDFDYLYKNKYYYSPSSNERVFIDYEKYNDYYTYNDKIDFWTSYEKRLNANSSFIINRGEAVKNKNTETCIFILKDTATSRALKVVAILKDGVFCRLTASYDTIIGLEKWTKDFLNTFTLNDTVIGKNIFEPKFDLLLNDLVSSDSAKKYAATQSVYSLNYDKSNLKKYTDFISTSSFLKLDEATRASLIMDGSLFKHEGILPQFKKLYTHYTDSSYMQTCIIKSLAFIKTKESIKTILELLKQEAPLTNDGYVVSNMLSPLYDSLELCKELFPALSEFTRFDEYKEPIYQLQAALVDKKIIASTIYASQKQMLLTEANYELKRFKPTANTTDIYGGNGYGTEKNYDVAMTAANQPAYSNTTSDNSTEGKSLLEAYSALLVPFYNSDPSVKAFFGKLLKVKDDNLLMTTYLNLLKQKVSINDSLSDYFSKTPSTRISFYTQLKEQKLTANFSNAYLTQEEFCKAAIKTHYNYNQYDYYDSNPADQSSKTDTLTFLQKVDVSNKYEKGYVYFFKRSDPKNKKTILSYAFVNNTKDDVNTVIDVIETKKVVEKDETIDTIIKAVKSEFYYKHRKRYLPDNLNAYNYPSGGGY